jgi:hypothetical protein
MHDFFQQVQAAAAAVCLVSKDMHFNLISTAGAYLYDVRNCSDMRKDSQGISELLYEIACSVVGDEDHGHMFGGWTLDNTEANMKALRALSSDEDSMSYKWINVGCTAHGLALAMKDFCEYDAGKGKAAKQNSWGLKWLTDVNRNANTVANFLHDSSCARDLLVDEQKAIYLSRAAVPVSVPTRFATNLFVMKGIDRNKKALQHTVKNQEWPKAHSGNGSKVREIVELESFWQELTYEIEFLQPLSDMIHQIEADKPALGRCYQGLQAIDCHVRACVEKWLAKDLISIADGETAIRTWERRYVNEH